MSLLHLFSFYETQHHPLIARAGNPYLASKVWGVIQLFFGVITLALGRYQFGFNPQTLFVFSGFSFWGVFLGIVSGKRYRQQGNTGKSEIPSQPKESC